MKILSTLNWKSNGFLGALVLIALVAVLVCRSQADLARTRAKEKSDREEAYFRAVFLSDASRVDPHVSMFLLRSGPGYVPRDQFYLEQLRFEQYARDLEEIKAPTEFQDNHKVITRIVTEQGQLLAQAYERGKNDRSISTSSKNYDDIFDHWKVLGAEYEQATRPLTPIGERIFSQIKLEGEQLKRQELQKKDFSKSKAP